jgi:hypothetical protein
MTQKYQIKMQILTKACQKNWFPTCSVIVKMFEHRNLAKIEGKEAKKLSKIDQGHKRF